MKGASVLVLSLFFCEHVVLAQTNACDGIGEKMAYYRLCLGEETKKLKEQIQTTCTEAAGTDPSELDICRNSASAETISSTAQSNCKLRAKLDEPCPTSPPVSELSDSADSGAKKGKPQPVPTAKNPKPKKPVDKNKKDRDSSERSSAMDEADEDLETCKKEENLAIRCCQNPMSCSSQLSAADRGSLNQVNGLLSGQGPGQLGTQEYCRQLSLLSSSGSSINSGFSAICISNQTQCTSTCGNLITKYERLLDRCDSCDSESVYESVLQRLTAGRNSCSRLRANADKLGSNGVAMANPSAYAQYCQSTASAFPQGANYPPGSVPSTNDSYGCALNPQSPECRAIEPKDSKGELSFSNEPSKDPAFNLSGVDPAMSKISQDSEAKPSQVVSVKSIPNGGGGSFGGGGSSQNAQLDDMGGKLGPGHNTDIEQGFRSGSGYSYGGAGGSLEPQSSGRGYSATGSDFGSNTPVEVGVDLRNYLPGGKRDPARRLAGNSVRAEINSKEQDIWQKISNKLTERCRLGRLWRCR